MMIISVDQSNILRAAEVHSASWQESHRSFCSPEFVALHTPEHQQAYIKRKMDGGSEFYLLTEDAPIGIVSVNGSLIEDLYVLPDRQNRGYGTALLRFAVSKCTGTPTLWILENNVRAKRLYCCFGFKETGQIHAIANGLDEIELSLPRIAGANPENAAAGS